MSKKTKTKQKTWIKTYLKENIKTETLKDGLSLSHPEEISVKKIKEMICDLPDPILCRRLNKLIAKYRAKKHHPMKNRVGTAFG